MKKLLFAILLVCAAYSASYAQRDIPGTLSTKDVTLFFDGGGMLEPEIRSITAENATEYGIKAVMDELIKGSTTYARTIPKSATLTRVFLDSSKTVYLDFSLELKKDHPGGVTTEMLTIASICRSIFINFDVNAVRILVDGVEAETIAGHMDIMSPFTRTDVEKLLTSSK